MHSAVCAYHQPNKERIIVALLDGNLKNNQKFKWVEVGQTSYDSHFQIQILHLQVHLETPHISKFLI